MLWFGDIHIVPSWKMNAWIWVGDQFWISLERSLKYLSHKATGAPERQKHFSLCTCNNHCREHTLNYFMDSVTSDTYIYNWEKYMTNFSSQTSDCVQIFVLESDILSLQANNCKKV